MLYCIIYLVNYHYEFVLNLIPNFEYFVPVTMATNSYNILHQFDEEYKRVVSPSVPKPEKGEYKVTLMVLY